MKTIMWFRQDFRLSDNPALIEAVSSGEIIPIYILDDINSQSEKIGDASRVWLHYSLFELNKSLNGNLRFFKGEAKEIVSELIRVTDSKKIVWNRCYEPWRIKRDTYIKKDLKELGIEVKSCNGSLLWEPQEICKSDGMHYRVFTPFYRRGCLNAVPPRIPQNAPLNIKFAEILNLKRDCSLEEFELLPKHDWYISMVKNWKIGEQGGLDDLDDFLKNGIVNYKMGRNIPAKKSVSRLSPRLHFGELSPNQVWYAAQQVIEPGDSNLDSFLSELGWREFAYHLHFHYPSLANENLNPKFNSFAWKTETNNIKAWQTGMTGYPIVDAGMRELYQTGYMHNRLRMIVGSFLVKNLLQHWHHGRDWFHNCLVDADLCVNSASWQWIAGCGADAAPYFRIFNPITQGEKFDPEGEYTKKWVPELINIPKKFLFCPWQASAEILEKSGIQLGTTYPMPIVDLKVSRNLALEAFSKLPKTA